MRLIVKPSYKKRNADTNISTYKYSTVFKKNQKLTDKELTKLLKTEKPKKMIDMHMMSIIKLSDKQLSRVIEAKNKEGIK